MCEGGRGLEYPTKIVGNPSTERYVATVEEIIIGNKLQPQAVAQGKPATQTNGHVVGTEQTTTADKDLLTRIIPCA